MAEYTNNFYDENGIDLGFSLGMSWDSGSDVIDFVPWNKTEISKTHTIDEFKKLAKDKSNKITFVTFKNPIGPRTPVGSRTRRA